MSHYFENLNWHLPEVKNDKKNQKKISRKIVFFFSKIEYILLYKEFYQFLPPKILITNSRKYTKIWENTLNSAIRNGEKT